jgi:hypothetical protein
VPQPNAGTAAGIFFTWKVVTVVVAIATFTWVIGLSGVSIFVHQVERTRDWAVTLVSTSAPLRAILADAACAVQALRYRPGNPGRSRTAPPSAWPAQPSPLITPPLQGQRKC